MESSLTTTPTDFYQHIDIIQSIYRTRGDLKMLRHIGFRDIISTMKLPIIPTGASTIGDFFSWVISDIDRCAKYNITMYPVLGIPPIVNFDPKMADKSLFYLEELIRDNKIIGIGEIGMGYGSKEEYQLMKRQLKLAGKYNLPVIIEAPRQEKVAYVSIILKELQKHNVSRVIFDGCDIETLQLVLRAHNKNIKAALTVGKQAIKPPDAVRIYRNYSYDDRIILNSGLGMNETSLFGLIQTIEEFEIHFNDLLIRKLTYLNYLDVFPSISQDIRNPY